LSAARVLVCTLENGEAEFEEARLAILAQSGVEVVHIVISGLNEKAAHLRLGQIWNHQRQRFDMFAKIDADTVLSNSLVLTRVFTRMKEANATGLQIRLKDYFSDSMILGANFFSPEVHFRRARLPLFPDHSDVGHSKVLKGDQLLDLEPVGYHCKYPNAYQSYHYGYRRFLKNQLEIVKQVIQVWKREKDPAREWAVKGFIDASKRRSPKVLFSSKQVNSSFRRSQRAALTTNHLELEVRKLEERIMIEKSKP
jgi:hypothetical protein